MPDITMCKAEGCTLKDECYRFLAKPSEIQAYFAVSPYDIKYGCEYYWPIEHAPIAREAVAPLRKYRKQTQSGSRAKPDGASD